MQSFALLTFVALPVLATLSCTEYAPADIGWLENTASGYLTKDPKDDFPFGHDPDLSLNQSSPWGIDGYFNGEDYFFGLFNCTSKTLGIESRATYQCHPASKKGSYTNTTTRTDFLQIQAHQNLCLTVNDPTKDQSELSYTPCNSNPKDLRQLFKAVRIVEYPQGTCGGDPPNENLLATQIIWEERPYSGRTSHWHLKNASDLHSEVLLKRKRASDERFVFFIESS